MYQQMSRRAFSLIELAIVIAILGLLAGGIMGGKVLIRSSELRSVMTEAAQYSTSINTFNSQFRGLPGDIPNAQNYWSDATNGNGDGAIDSSVIGTELFQVWFQLNKAGMLDQNLTGVTNFGTVLGENIPKARISQTGFAAYYYNRTSTVHTTHYMQNYGNTLVFGGWTTSNAPPYFSTFTPSEAYTIDTKADDGIPATGTWVASLMNTGAGTGGAFGNAAACTTDNSAVATTPLVYRLTSEIASCSFFIKTGL